MNDLWAVALLCGIGSVMALAGVIVQVATTRIRPKIEDACEIMEGIDAIKADLGQAADTIVAVFSAEGGFTYLEKDHAQRTETGRTETTESGVAGQWARLRRRGPNDGS